MASAADLFPRPKTPRHGVQGVVVTAPSGTDDMLTAEWEVDSFDGPEAIAEKRIRWVSNGRMPAVGDDALMVTDDRGDVWAFVWATGLSSGGTSITARSAEEFSYALDMAAETPGLTVEVPTNTHLVFDEPPSIPPGMGLRGGGRSTVIEFQGCDGFVFETSDYIGPQRFENFAMFGNDFDHVGVSAQGNADFGRIQGVVFQDVLMWNFRAAFDLRSTHGWRISHVTAHDVWQAIDIAGQTILITVDGGSEFSRDNATGSGDSTGWRIATATDYNPGGVTERGSEGIRVRDTTFFGFDIGMDHVSALDTLYDGVTVGMVGDTGIKVTGVQGSLRIRNPWIGYATGAQYGIRAVPLGAPLAASLTIEGVHAAKEAGQTPDANLIGCSIESNHTGSLSRSTFEDSGLHHVRLNFAGNFSVDNIRAPSATSGAGLQLVAFPGGPYYIGDGNEFGSGILEHASNTGEIHYGRPTVRTAASAPINSTYVDSVDGKLYFKDGAGVTHATY